MALPIFASDALSSVAYAPQELVMILLIGGLTFLSFTPLVAIAVVVLLVVVVLSYRQLIKAYPSGGGDYEVASKNLGEIPGVIVAAALLVDYVLTVAVSVASGVDNIISAVPGLDPFRIELAVGFVVLIIVVNLRGVREASLVFAIPTYVFIGSVGIMIVTGLIRTFLGDAPVASSAEFSVQAESLGQAAVILLILRAFSSGCSALTGVEAVSNGVPAFRAPKVRNAQSTLVLMGSIAICLSPGSPPSPSSPACTTPRTPATSSGSTARIRNPPDGPDRRSDLRRRQHRVLHRAGGDRVRAPARREHRVQRLPAAGGRARPRRLRSEVAQHPWRPPRVLERHDPAGHRGDRGARDLPGEADHADPAVHHRCVRLVLARTDRHGAHWRRVLRGPVEDTKDSGVDGASASDRRSAKVGLIINSAGAVMTVLVLVIVTITKFTHGAYLVFFAIPILAFLMLGVKRYYRDVEHEIAIDDTTRFGATGDLAIVLVNRLQKPVVKAIDYAIAAKHGKTLAVHVAVASDDAAQLQTDWADHLVPIPLVIVESPYRSFAQPVTQFIKQYREKHGSSVVTVYLPQYIVGHWWESFLHNRRARRLANQLMLVHGVSITLVPWLLDSSELIYGRRSRPLPGQERAGRPVVVNGRRAHRPAGPPQDDAPEA